MSDRAPKKKPGAMAGPGMRSAVPSSELQCPLDPLAPLPDRLEPRGLHRVVQVHALAHGSAPAGPLNRKAPSREAHAGQDRHQGAGVPEGPRRQVVNDQADSVLRIVFGGPVLDGNGVLDALAHVLA